MKILPKRPFQVLVIKNRLEKSIKMLANSLNIVPNLFWSSKYNIRNNHIYPRGKTYDVVAFFIMICLNSVCIYRTLVLDDVDEDVPKLERALLSAFNFFYVIYFMIGFTMNFILTFAYKQENISLILKIQSIYLGIGFRKRIRGFIIWSWISIIALLFTDFFIYVIYYTSAEFFFIYECICDTMFIALDVSIVVSMRFIILLRKYVEEWIKQGLMMNSGRQDGERCNNLFRIYKNILKAYVLYKKIFHVLVFYHSFGVFYRNLVYFHIILSAVRMFYGNGDDTVYNILSVCLWQTKNMCLIILQSILCEKFYISVEEVDSACIQLLKDKTCSKNTKHFCKNIIRSNETFNKMTACGMFSIDATLPLSLAGIISNYVVVLLQFSLSKIY